MFWLLSSTESMELHLLLCKVSCKILWNKQVVSFKWLYTFSDFSFRALVNRFQFLKVELGISILHIFINIPYNIMRHLLFIWCRTTASLAEMMLWIIFRQDVNFILLLSFFLGFASYGIGHWWIGDRPIWNIFFYYLYK